MMKSGMMWGAVLLTAVLYSCHNQRNSAHDLPRGSELISNASLLSIIESEEGYYVTIRNPWDTASVLRTYWLVPHGSEAHAPEGALRMEVPLTRSVIYSGVHGGAIDELGALDKVAGVADGQYFTHKTIKSRIEVGNIVDVGAATSPDLEKLIRLQPDAILASPYQNAGYGAVEQISTPIVDMADYMEATPLGRAEWIKLLGILYGEYEKSDSIYRSVSLAYDSLRTIAASAEDKPKVITEIPINGVWALPGGSSYKAQMLRDAGAMYPWSDDTSAGSLQLDFSAVFSRASDADYWLTLSYGYPLTLSALRADYTPFERIKAWKLGNVYTADTSIVPIFDEFPFHPERLLADYIMIFHPQLIPDGQLRYLHRAPNE